MRTSKSKPRAPRKSPGLARLGAVLAGLAVISGCAGGSAVNPGDAYMQIKPKEKLPERESGNQPANLVVKVYNVADNRHSYKNYVELYVNDHEVKPSMEIDNLTSTYVYSLRLQEGVYDVRAEYHSVGGWRGRVVKIVVDEPVKILPNQRATLDARLVKDARGQLMEPEPTFRLRYTDTVASVQIPD